MFNVSIFLLLSAVVVAANFIAIPKIIDLTSYKSGREERKVLLASTLANSLFLSIGAVAVGCYMAPRMNLAPRFLEALISLDQPHLKFLHLLVPASVTSLLILLGMLLIQIALVNRCLSLPNYFSLPISTRILKEGVIEEVIYRWALLPTIARILTTEFSFSTEKAIFFAIIISALGSSLSHIADLLRFSFRRVDLGVLAILTHNVWGALIYGWLFCQHGLTAAITCHAIVILISSVALDLKYISAGEPSH